MEPRGVKGPFRLLAGARETTSRYPSSPIAGGLNSGESGVVAADPVGSTSDTTPGLWADFHPEPRPSVATYSA